MHSPLQPWQQCHAPPPQYLGTDGYGQPVYGTPPAPATGGVAPLQPIVARPWGMYLAGGCLGVIALAVLGTVAVFLMLGLAAVAVCIALCAVALTICVLMLRSTFRQTQREKRK